MRPFSEQKVLLLQPFLNYYGGAEYMLGVVANEIFPHASVLTFSYQDKILAEMGLSESRVKAPFGKGFLGKTYRQMTPLYPSLVDNMSFDEYDLVLSFSYGYVHGAVTSHNQLHVSYIQTPMRLLWLNESEYYGFNKIPLVKNIYQSILAWQRVWDRQAAMRPDYLLSNSKEVSNRVKTFWGRESTVVHPPVDTEFYAPKKPVKKEEYFVTHSRLVRYKRIDILIEACKAQKKKLVVVGNGPDYKRLKQVAGGSTDITFTGYATHEEKRDILQKAQGFLFASEEDFGIAPVEALAAGLPVLAYGKGGILETTTPDTGMYYKAQTSDAVAHQLPLFEKFVHQVNHVVLQRQAEKFSKQRFVQQYTNEITKKAAVFEKNGPPTFV